MNIVCVEPLGIATDRFEQLRTCYAQKGHNFTYYLDRDEDANELVQRMCDADVVAISNIRLTAEILNKCSRLKYLSVAFTGLDHIDLDYCKSHGIEVQNAAGYSTTAVSELTVGLIIDLMRRITVLDNQTRIGGTRGAFLGRELRGKTVGIVGTGAIGTAVAKLLLAFGCKVLAYSRTKRQEVELIGGQYTDMQSLLQQSDIVSLHVPLNSSTYHLIGKEQLDIMKPSALLINTARGNVCDIDAVAEALTSDKISGAAFDVYEQEPPLPSNHPLLHLPNCICTPHIAFATKESFAERAEIVFNHINTFLK
ncbi:MAG: hydroxyacid dehydrogenase [Bacteroidales bacterium]|nr:hydroxyacid dehydrogenase [Bacteroidales bacterium]